MKTSIYLLFSLYASVCLATKPASTADVDAAMANLQSQIDTINSLVNALYTIPAVAHPVGSCYGGGVVYYASSDANAPPGQRGLIAAPSDALSSTTMAWESVGSTLITPTTQKNYFAGKDNTESILKTIGPVFPAASAAGNYITEGDTCAECTVWYLPSQDELATLYAQSTSSIALGDTTFWSACNGTTPGLTKYWSSTQGQSSSAAFSTNFLTGIVSTNTTTLSFRVRAVRAF